jgi:hypothetical protein
VLLIVAALTPERLRDLHALAHRLGMAALVEVHTAEELETAMTCDPALVGINNRDLHTFVVSLATTERLCRALPAAVCVVAESGIHSESDVAIVAAIPRPDTTGVDAILVGEALVTAPDVGAKVRRSRLLIPTRAGSHVIAVSSSSAVCTSTSAAILNLRASACRSRSSSGDSAATISSTASAPAARAW